jgi:hypothetical protein
MREQIKDASGRTIGFQEHISDYRETVTDSSGALLGHFNPHTGKTHDRSGKVVSSSGDVRTSLIPKGKK